MCPAVAIRCSTRRDTLVRCRTVSRRFKLRFQAWNKQINKRAECRCMRGHGTGWRWIKKDTNCHLGERTTKRIKWTHSHPRGYSLLKSDGGTCKITEISEPSIVSPRSRKEGGEENEQRRRHLWSQNHCNRWIFECLIWDKQWQRSVAQHIEWREHPDRQPPGNAHFSPSLLRVANKFLTLWT